MCRKVLEVCGSIDHVGFVAGSVRGSGICADVAYLAFFANNFVDDFLARMSACGELPRGMRRVLLFVWVELGSWLRSSVGKCGCKIIFFGCVGGDIIVCWVDYHHEWSR